MKVCRELQALSLFLLACGAPPQDAAEEPHRWVALAEHPLSTQQACATESDCGGGLACVAGQCQPCSAHGQCSSDLCDTYWPTSAGLGRCLPESVVVFVDRGAPGCASGDGTRGRPVCDIPDGVSRAVGARFAVRVRASGGAYKQFRITNRTVYLYGDPTPITCQDTIECRPYPFVDIAVTGSAARVVMDGFNITGLNLYSTGNLHLRRVNVSVSPSASLVASGELTMDRVGFFGDREVAPTGSQNGVYVGGGTRYRISNSVFQFPGPALDERVFSVVLAAGSSGRFLFNSVTVRGRGGERDYLGVVCGGGQLLEDSVINGALQRFSRVAGCGLERVILPTDDSASGPGVIKSDDPFAGVDRGNPYPASSSINTDFLGTPRPRGPRPDIGAFEYR